MKVPCCTCSQRPGAVLHSHVRAYVRDVADREDETSVETVLAQVRGYKTVSRFFPHEVASMSMPEGVDRS